MSRFLAALAATSLLIGCDSANPFQTEEEDTDTTAPVIDEGEEVSSEGIPAALSGVNGAVNLESVAYDPDTRSLSVDMNALDSTDSDTPLQAYGFNANLTALAPGYQVYSYQDDGLDRMFVAIVGQTADGSSMGAVVMDGGQFNKFFGGGFYATDGDYTPGVGENDTGLVSYAGTYASVTNLDADGAELIGLPGGINDVLLPAQPAQISGSIFINADFGDNQLNGAIYDREYQNLHPDWNTAFGLDNGVELPDVILTPAPIADDGTFFGTAENSAQEGIGSYGGTFGGDEAAGVSGVVALDGDWLGEDYVEIDNEYEFGVFVLVQCGLDGDAAICDTPVNPN